MRMRIVRLRRVGDRAIWIAALLGLLRGATGCEKEATASAPVEQAMSPFVGSWLGTLHSPDGGLGLALHITRDPCGGFGATLDSLHQSAFGIAASTVQVDGTTP